MNFWYMVIEEFVVHIENVNRMIKEINFFIFYFFLMNIIYKIAFFVIIVF